MLRDVLLSGKVPLSGGMEVGQRRFSIAMEEDWPTLLSSEGTGLPTYSASM